MKCEKCGAPLTGGAKFCAKCGTAVHQSVGDSAQIHAAEADNRESLGARPDFDTGEIPGISNTNQAPVYQAVNNQDQPQAVQGFPQEAYAAVPVSNKRKYIWIPVLIGGLAVITAVVLAIYNTSFAGMNGLFRAFENTSNVYEKEMKIMEKENPVFAKTGKLIEDNSFSMDSTLNVYGEEYQLILDSDLKSGIANAELNIPVSLRSIGSAAGLGINVYTNSDKIVLGADNILYAESSYKDLKDDILAFSDKNDLDIDEEYLEAFDFDGAIDQKANMQDAEKFCDDIYSLFKSFLAVSEMKKSEDFIQIGDNEESCDRYDFIFAGADMAAWLENDFVQWFDSDDAKWVQNMVLSLGGYSDKEEAIEEIKDAAKEIADDESQGMISFMVYDNVVVAAEISDDDMTMRLSVNGGDYRLNRIAIEMYDEYNDFSMVLEGNHMNSANIESTLTITDDDYSETVTINWDTASEEDNVVIRSSDGDELAFTFAVQDEKVVYEVVPESEYDMGISVVISPLEEELQFPENTVPLSDVDLEDIMKQFQLNELTSDSGDF